MDERLLAVWVEPFVVISAETFTAVWRIEMKMKNSKSKFVGHWLVLTALVFGARLVDAPRSYGEEAPKFDNAREETRRLNRRAVLVVKMQ
jgi:hypothetical protein